MRGNQSKPQAVAPEITSIFKSIVHFYRAQIFVLDRVSATLLPFCFKKIAKILSSTPYFVHTTIADPRSRKPPPAGIRSLRLGVDIQPFDVRLSGKDYEGAQGSEGIV
jgi:hypothetical protein